MDDGTGAGIQLIVGLITALLVIVPLWRIFRRAGLAAPLSLLVLVPGLGWLIALAILAFARWPTARE